MSEIELPSHPFDLFMDAAAGYMAQANRAIRQARESVPAVRVVRVSAPEAEVIGTAIAPKHVCGEECDNVACVITDEELEVAYRNALHRLNGIKFAMGGPVSHEGDDPSYDELIKGYRAQEHNRTG